MQNDRNRRVSGYANDFQGAQTITLRYIDEKHISTHTLEENEHAWADLLYRHDRALPAKTAL